MKRQGIVLLCAFVIGVRGLILWDSGKNTVFVAHVQNGMKRIALVLLLTTLLSFLVLLPSVVHADGGAPNLAYVAGGAQGVSVIDIAQRKVITSLPVEGEPSSVLLSLDGSLLYIAQPTLQQVTVIAPKTKQVVCTAHVSGSPTLLTLDAAQGVVYVAGNTSSSITVLHSTNCAVLNTLSLHSPVYGLALSNASSTANSATHLWVAGLNDLSVFDVHDKLLVNVPIPQGPRFLCIPGGNTVYVTTQQGEVIAVDTTTYRVSSPLLTGRSFGPMDYDATTGEVFVPNMQGREIDVLAPISVGDANRPREPSRVLHFDTIPQSIAITNDGLLGMVALANGTVAILDIPARQIITTIAVGGHPRFIITGLYPPPFNLTQQQFSLLNASIDALHYILAGVIALVALIAVLRYRRLTREAEKQQK